MSLDRDICSNCGKFCEIMNSIDSEASRAVVSSMVRVRYRKKETIIKQNSHATHLIFLNEGLVKVFTERRNEKNIILNIAKPNTFIGLSEIASDVYNFSAVSLTDCQVCLLPKEQLFHLIEQNQKFSKFIFEEQSKHTSFLIDKISSLGTKQMHGRLADAILYLCSNHFQDVDVYNYITRRDMAEMSGMSSESAIRLLTEFKNDGLIKLDGKKIHINNYELMHRLSEIG